MKIEVDLDTVTGLVLEFAECHHINIKIVQQMNEAYDIRNPSDEEKIQFLRAMLPLIPVNSYLVDLVKNYLVALDAGHTDYENAKVEKVSDYLLEDGGLVIVYRVKSTELSDFFVATFDDGDDEVLWGASDTIEDTLRVAEREWDHFNHDEGPTKNPFTEALEHIQS